MDSTLKMTTINAFEAGVQVIEHTRESIDRLEEAVTSISDRMEDLGTIIDINKEDINEVIENIHKSAQDQRDSIESLYSGLNDNIRSLNETKDSVKNMADELETFLREYGQSIENCRKIQLQEINKIKEGVSEFQHNAEHINSQLADVSFDIKNSDFKVYIEDIKKHSNHIKENIEEFNEQCNKIIEAKEHIEEINESINKIDKSEINENMSQIIGYIAKFNESISKFDENFFNLNNELKKSTLMENMNILEEKFVFIDNRIDNISDKINTMYKNQQALDNKLADIVNKQCKNISDTLNKILYENIRNDGSISKEINDSKIAMGYLENKISLLDNKLDQLNLKMVKRNENFNNSKIKDEIVEEIKKTIKGDLISAIGTLFEQKMEEVNTKKSMDATNELNPNSQNGVIDNYNRNIINNLNVRSSNILRDNRERVNKTVLNNSNNNVNTSISNNSRSVNLSPSSNKGLFTNISKYEEGMRHLDNGNYEDAYNSFKKGAESEDLQSIEKVKELEKMFYEKARKNDSNCQYIIGNIERGKNNYKGALEMYKMAGLNGHMEARSAFLILCNSLSQDKSEYMEYRGDLYLKGIFVDKDEERAKGWYKKAADKGRISAREKLKMYFNIEIM